MFIMQVSVVDATVAMIQFTESVYPVNENGMRSVCIELQEGIQISRPLNISYLVMDNPSSLQSAGRFCV